LKVFDCARSTTGVVTTVAATRVVLRKRRRLTRLVIETSFDRLRGL
jgi:hypothetical protein